MQRCLERAVSKLSQALRPAEVAQIVDVCRRSVRRCKAAVRDRGRKALRAKLAPGGGKMVEAFVLQSLDRDLREGARAAGFPADLWTCLRVVELFQSHWGVHCEVCRVRGY